MKMLMELKGLNGQIQLYEDKIIITRKGFRAKMSQGFFKGDKSIYLSHITGIQLKHTGILTNGYIQFTLSGGNESTRGMNAATKDENSVIFVKKNNKLADKLKDEIECLKRLSQVRDRVVMQISAVDEIRKYNQLLIDGIISEAEFNLKKAELLKRG